MSSPVPELNSGTSQSHMTICRRWRIGCGSRW